MLCPDAVRSADARSSRGFLSWYNLIKLMGGVNYTYEFDLGTNNPVIDIGIHGYLNVLLTEEGGWMTLAGGVRFIGVQLSGELVLSLNGGVQKALLEGSGSTRDIPFLDIVCPACPVLEGSFRAVYDELVFPIEQSLEMYLYFSWLGFTFEGFARFIRSGELDILFISCDPGDFLVNLVDAIIDMLAGVGLRQLTDHPAVKAIRDLFADLRLPALQVDYQRDIGLVVTVTLRVDIPNPSGIGSSIKERHVAWSPGAALSDMVALAQSLVDVGAEVLLAALADLDIDVLPRFEVDFGIDKISIDIPEGINDIELKFDAWDWEMCSLFDRRRLTSADGELPSANVTDEGRELPPHDVLLDMSASERRRLFGEDTFWANGALYAGRAIRSRDGLILDPSSLRGDEVDVYDTDALGRIQGHPHRARVKPQNRTGFYVGPGNRRGESYENSTAVRLSSSSQSQSATGARRRLWSLGDVPCGIVWRENPIQFTCCENVIIPRTEIVAGAHVSLHVRLNRAYLRIQAWLKLDSDGSLGSFDVGFDEELTLLSTGSSPSICELVLAIQPF